MRQSKVSKVSLALCTVAFLVAGSPITGVATVLELELESEQPDIVLGEPFYVTAILRNDATQSVEVLADLDPQVEALHLEVTDPEGTTRRFVPLSIADVDGPFETLKPGEEVRDTFPVFFGASGWTFENPGTHHLLASYTDTKVRSNALSVEVRELDKSGSFLMDDNGGQEAGLFLKWMAGDHLDDGIRRLEGLVRMFPDSPLVNYAHLALGVSLSRPFRDYTIDEVRLPKCSAALAHLNEVDTGPLPSILVKREAEARARCEDSSWGCCVGINGQCFHRSQSNCSGAFVAGAGCDDPACKPQDSLVPELPGGPLPQPELPPGGPEVPPGQPGVPCVVNCETAPVE